MDEYRPRSGSLQNNTPNGNGSTPSKGKDTTENLKPIAMPKKIDW